ncbi:DUF7144 family membrane protein [Streptomyces sp.]|uniref:DUF7144 family membrane protein n=1 Tax=Streptomyces sp. TaxID=1931 RepID=UPI002D2D3BCE|nr:hypothetical protein [Streptomyces sp.]HZF87219.1 hypothetical protein [Streptomyces sp.]
MTRQPRTPESPVWDPSHQGTGSAPRSAGNGWATGGTVFAGVLMLVNGLLAVLQGIAAIAEDDVYARLGDYVYEVSLTGWGWILVILGAVAAATGVGILQGAAWARAVGILLASLSLIAQFLFLPYAPLWSMILIAIDFFVIWALATHHPGARPRA